MKSITVSDDIIDVTIQRTMDFEARHGSTLQIDITDKNMNEPFLRRLHELAEITRIDALGGSKAPDNFRRYEVDKKFEDVIQHAHTGIKTGIKVCHRPMMKFREWEQWPDGYIEGFTRMDGDKEHHEYFIWTYIKMENLHTILEEFKDELKYYYH